MESYSNIYLKIYVSNVIFFSEERKKKLIWREDIFKNSLPLRACSGTVCIKDLHTGVVL